MSQQIIVYIKEITIKDKTWYGYTFKKNPALFKWLLSITYIEYDKYQKVLFSEPKEEILDYIELKSNGRIHFNKFQLQNKHIQEFS